MPARDRDGRDRPGREPSPIMPLAQDDTGAAGEGNQQAGQQRDRRRRPTRSHRVRQSARPARAGDNPVRSGARRNLIKPTSTAARPTAAAASQGRPGGPGRGAVPPRPVSGPPLGVIWLPTASTRLTILSWPESSSTTRVWMLPAGKVTLSAACSVTPAARTVTVPAATVW